MSTASIFYENPDLKERYTYKEPVRRNYFPMAKQTRYLTYKYVLSRIVAVIALFVLSPLLLLVAILIKLDSRGPLFFTHERHGMAGRPFKMIKFRTMIPNAHTLQKDLQDINEMRGGGLFKSDNDPRVTRVGKFLRKYSIDELPQLINIVRGEMTIIGPRPLSTPLELYEPQEMKRFALLPGLGCIWQAHFRKETDFRMWMKTDCIYVEAVSFVLDMKLLFTIAYNVVIGRGAR